jgi:hypothetical protein
MFNLVDIAKLLEQLKPSEVCSIRAYLRYPVHLQSDCDLIINHMKYRSDDQNDSANQGLPALPARVIDVGPPGWIS